MAEPVRLTGIAHTAWAESLFPGDWAVDATCGNGHDTAFLARAVRPDGRVFAFDLQESAVKATTRRLQREGLLDRVTLIKADHARLGEHLPCSAAGRVALVTFNLGYLPFGDHAVTTRPDTTLPALRGALKLLKPGGLLSVIAYRGHEGAMEEADAVSGFFKSPDAPWKMIRHESTGTADRPGPVWWWVAAP